MGRRSSHTPDELRKLIIDATREIIEENGLVGLSARLIARRISYSAGTIYNVFENLDDLLLTIQVNMLDDAVETLKGVKPDGDARKHVVALARRYVDFALQHARLWNLLFQHQPVETKHIPAPLHEKVNDLIAVVATGMKPMLGKATMTEVDRAARVLWAGVHGISAIAVTNKSPTMTTETAQWYAAQLIDAVLDGIRTK